MHVELVADAPDRAGPSDRVLTGLDRQTRRTFTQFVGYLWGAAMIVTLLGLGALHQTRGDSVAGGPRSQFCDHTAPSGELPTPRSHQTMVIRAKPPGGRAFASCPPRWEPVASACPPGRTDPVGPTTTHWQGPTLRATCRAARIPAPDRRFHRPRTMTTPPALGSSVQRFHAVVRRPCMSSSRPEVPMPHFGAALRGAPISRSNVRHDGPTA